MHLPGRIYNRRQEHPHGESGPELPAQKEGEGMARSLVFLCCLTMCLALLPDALAQKTPPAAYAVLNAERQALLAQRQSLLNDLANYSDRVRAYGARNQQTAASIAQMNTMVGRWGKWVQDQRKQRQAQLRFEMDCLRRERDQLEGQRQDLLTKLKRVSDGLIRVDTALAALKATPPPPE